MLVPEYEEGVRKAPKDTNGIEVGNMPIRGKVENLLANRMNEMTEALKDMLVLKKQKKAKKVAIENESEDEEHTKAELTKLRKLLK